MEVEFRNSIESAILICSELAEKRWRGPFQWLDHWFCWRRNLKIENAVAIFSACSGHTEIGLPNNRLMTSERLHSIRQCEPIDRSWSGGGPVRREVVTAMQMASQVSQTNDWTKAFFEREREREREREKASNISQVVAAMVPHRPRRVVRSATAIRFHGWPSTKHQPANRTLWVELLCSVWSSPLSYSFVSSAFLSISTVLYGQLVT